MKKIGVMLAIILVFYLLLVNLTPGYFEWGCNGEVTYSNENRGCQILPKPHSQNLVNNFLLFLNVFDLNKQLPD